VQSNAADKRLEVAARLADKAFQQGHRIYINACDELQANALNQLLWSFRPASFLPHGIEGEHGERAKDGTAADNGSDTIGIGWGQEPQKHNDLLINLQLQVPPFFSRFARVAEVVTQEEKSLAALRISWRFYEERGYQLEKHDL